MKKSSWHSTSTSALVHHVCPTCPFLKAIRVAYLSEGTGGRPLCRECERRSEEGSCGDVRKARTRGQGTGYTKNASACYHGQKWGNVYGPDGGELDPGPSLRVLIHSHGGFGWGEIGDGSAQLALALLLDVTGDPEVAVAFHEDFKASVLAKLPWPNPWRLDASAILSWLSGARADLEVNILAGADPGNDPDEHGEAEGNVEK